MDPRKQQKAAIRQQLLDVTVDSLASGRSFDSLSLREVARRAGIAPTSFYRHFHDMEELGLAVIDAHGKAVFALMERVKEQVSSGEPLIRASVEAVYDFIASNQGVSRMIIQESMSAESAFREASANLFLSMSSELAAYLEQEALKRDVPVGYPRLAANAMLSIIYTTGIALLNSPALDRERNVEAAVIKVKMIMLGAEQLADS